MGSALPLRPSASTSHPWVGWLSGPVGPSARTLRSFRCRLWSPGRSPLTTALSELRPLQSLTTGDPRAFCSSRAVPSRGCLPFSVRGAENPRSIHRACLTRLRAASRVSHPPGGFCLSAPSGLVSSRSRSWGSCPSESFPRDGPLRLSAPAAVLTSAVFSWRRVVRAPTPPHAMAGNGWYARRPRRPRERSGFTAFISARVRCLRTTVQVARGPMLSWAFASSGACPSAPRPASLRVSFPGLHGDRLPAASRPRACRHRCPPKSYRMRRLAGLSRDRLPLPRFPTLSRRSSVYRVPGFGLMGSPRAARSCHHSAPALFEPGELSCQRPEEWPRCATSPLVRR
jgi:hypothetical protein